MEIEKIEIEVEEDMWRIEKQERMVLLSKNGYPVAVYYPEFPETKEVFKAGLKALLQTIEFWALVRE